MLGFDAKLITLLPRKATLTGLAKRRSSGVVDVLFGLALSTGMSAGMGEGGGG